jgi:hypothetical protein
LSSMQVFSEEDMKKVRLHHFEHKIRYEMDMTAIPHAYSPHRHPNCPMENKTTGKKVLAPAIHFIVYVLAIRRPNGRF